MKHQFSLCLAILLFLPAAHASGKNPNKPQQNAFYWVPVAREFSPYAGFLIDDFDMEVENGELEVEYTLPIQLVGVEHELHFRGSAVPDAQGNLILTGENGKLTCRAVTSECHAKYENLPFSHDGALARIREIAANESEIVAREAVFSSFSTEGIGFLIFPK